MGVSRQGGLETEAEVYAGGDLRRRRLGSAKDAPACWD